MRALLSLMVRLFPQRFRSQFGHDLEEQIDRDYERATARGPLTAVAFVALTAVDLLRCAAAERWSPNWVGSDDTNEKKGGIGMWISDWTKHLRYAVRSLRRAPGFATVTVVTLGLAIGANTSIFTVIDTVLLEPLPYADQDRLVAIRASAPGSDLPDEFGVSAEFFVQYRDESHLLSEIGDLSVRRALGADRGQLIRGQLAEAFVLAGLAGGLAMILAWAGTPLFLQAAPPEIPRLAEVSISAEAALFTLALAIGAALVCGLAPAVMSSRRDATRLREGGRGTTFRRGWTRDALVVGQTSLALVLLIGSALLVRSFHALRNVDPGYDLDDLFTFQIAPEGAALTDAESFARFHLDF